MDCFLCDRDLRHEEVNQNSNLCRNQLLQTDSFQIKVISEITVFSNQEIRYL